MAAIDLIYTIEALHVYADNVSKLLPRLNVVLDLGQNNFQVGQVLILGLWLGIGLVLLSQLTV